MDIQRLAPESGIVDDALLQLDVRVDSVHDHLAQGAAHPV